MCIKLPEPSFIVVLSGLLLFGFCNLGTASMFLYFTCCWPHCLLDIQSFFSQHLPLLFSASLDSPLPL